MRKAFLILLFIILSSSVLAQILTNETDTTKTKPKLNKYFEYMQNFSSPQIVSRESFLNPSKLDTTQTGSIWLETRLAIMNNMQQNDFDASSYILQPYYNIYMENKGISLFRQFLGMAQLGAVGYLAYEHLKKYGLFHQP
jgi:hypothetical protein